MKISKIKFIVFYYFRLIANIAFTINRFIYLPEFRVVICKECKYVMLPNYIDAHFISEFYKLESLTIFLGALYNNAFADWLWQ